MQRATATTRTPNRRDLLLRSAVQSNEHRRFLFAAMPDITAYITNPEAATTLDAIWLKGKEFRPVGEVLETLADEASITIELRYLHDMVAKCHGCLCL